MSSLLSHAAASDSAWALRAEAGRWVDHPCRARTSALAKSPRAKTPRAIQMIVPMSIPGVYAGSTRHNEATRDLEVRPMAKAKDKGGDKNVKRAAQKSIKEKRAAKKAKKQASRSSA